MLADDELHVQPGSMWHQHDLHLNPGGLAQLALPRAVDVNVPVSVLCVVLMVMVMLDQMPWSQHARCSSPRQHWAWLLVPSGPSALQLTSCGRASAAVAPLPTATMGAARPKGPCWAVLLAARAVFDCAVLAGVLSSGPRCAVMEVGPEVGRAVMPWGVGRWGVMAAPLLLRPALCCAHIPDWLALAGGGGWAQLSEAAGMMASLPPGTLAAPDLGLPLQQVG